MKKKNQEQEFSNIASIGNFTKYAVENFEENIVSEKDFLEKIKEDKTLDMPHKFHQYLIITIT